MFAVAAPKVAERWLLMAHQTQGHRKDHQRNWATLPVAVVRLGRPIPPPVDTALGRGEPDLLGLPMQRQVDEVVGQLYLFRPEPVAERDFLRIWSGDNRRIGNGERFLVAAAAWRIWFRVSRRATVSATI